MAHEAGTDVLGRRHHARAAQIAHHVAVEERAGRVGYGGLLFVALGWTGDAYQAVALCVGAMVCIAASNAGNTSQDLKTGYILGATPKFQQWGLIIGVIVSVFAVGGTPAMAEEIRRLWRESAAPDLRILAMGGHEDGVISFGHSTEEAGLVLLRFLARGLKAAALPPGDQTGKDRSRSACVWRQYRSESR